MMNVHIKKLHPHAIIPVYQTQGSAGFDFTLTNDITIPAHGIVKVASGLVIAIPQNHVLLVFSRSSSPLKRGTTMANGVGVIDSDYCGPEDEIFYLVENITNTDVHLARGERVAQGVIVPVVQVQFEEQDMTAENRGGHGSTGV